MSTPEERIASLEARIADLEQTIRSMKALAKGEPGRDGKDGRDGRDGLDARPVNIKKIIAAVRGYITPEKPLNLNLHALLRPEITLSPELNVPAPNINFSPVMPEIKAPDVNVSVKPDVHVPKEALRVEIKAEVPQAPKPWPIETEVVERDVSGRAKIMRTKPIT